MAAIAGVVAYVKFYRAQPPPVFASDEDHFLFGSIRHRSGAGHAVLDLAGAAAHLSRAPAASGRLRGARHPRQGRPARCRSDCRRSRSAFPASASTARCAIRPAGANGPAAPPTIVAGGPAHQTGAQEYRRFLIACASDPRFTAHDPRRDREELRLSLLDRAAVPVRDHPVRPGGGCCARTRTAQWMDSRARMGARPDRSVQRGRSSRSCDSRSTTPSATADTVPLWNLEQRDGHGAVLGRVEHEPEGRRCCRRRSATARRGWVDRIER